MSNRVLTYAVVISIGVHLAILGVIGTTSASKPIEVESLKLVKVDLIKTPDDLHLNTPDQPKPEPSHEAEPAPYVPPVKQMQTAPVPNPRPKPVRGPYNVASNSVSSRPAGNPGGALNLGSTSANGQNLGATTGTSSVGYVSNPNDGAGVGTPDPPKHADPGPGTSPAVAPPPPPPTMVEVAVCAISGLRPNRWCEKKNSRSYRENDAPSGTCNVCKEPEPVHVNRLADRAEPELTRDAQVRVPESVMDEGIDATIKIQYTVSEDGGVSDVKVTGSSGNRELDRAVVDAARKMKYKPAVQDGVPRSVKKIRAYRVKV